MKYVFLIILLPFFLSACTTLSHSPESKPLHYKDSTTQVQVKFDEDDNAAVGSKVTALNRECATRPYKDRERTSCKFNLVGIGQIVGINNKISTVEFTDGSILSDTEYEVLKGEGK